LLFELIFPETAQHRNGRVGVLQNRFGLRASLATPSFGRRQLLLDDPLPDIEIAGNLCAGRISHRQLRYLDQTRFNRLDQPEIADHPREGLIRLLADATEIVWRGRQIDAEVDAAQLVYLVEPVDPYGCLLEELIRLLILSEQVVLLLVSFFDDAVGVVSLIVHHQHVLLSAHLAAEYSLNKGCIAFHISCRGDLHRLETPVLVVRLFLNLDHSRRNLSLQVVECKITSPASRGGLRTNGNGLCCLDSFAGSGDLGARPSRLRTLRLELVPVRHQDATLAKLRHEIPRHQVARAVKTRLAPFRVQLSQSASNRYIGADHQDDIRKSAIGARGYLVEDAPGCHHSHYGRLAAAGRHLAGVALKTGISSLVLLFPRLIARDGDPL